MLPLIYPGEEDGREARGALELFGLLLGVRARGGGDIDAEERRTRLLQIMLRVERQLGPDKPLVLIGEDAHWADQHSQDLFAELLRIPTHRPILGLLTTRPDAQLIARSREVGAQLIVLEELPEDARRQLIESRFVPGADADELIEQILERAGGNPLFIHEILDALLERGVVVIDADDAEHPGLLRWPRRDAQVVVPSSIEDALATRFDRPPPAEREVVLHGAVLGRDFSAAAVSDLLAAGRGRARRAGPARHPVADRHRRRGLPLRHSDMMMTVAYGLVEPSERERLHREAAARLGDPARYRPGQDDAAIARHLELAGAADAAADRYLRAAEHASRLRRQRRRVPPAVPSAACLVAPTDHARRFAVHRAREEILRRLARRLRSSCAELHALRREAEALGDVGKQAWGPRHPRAVPHRRRPRAGGGARRGGAGARAGPRPAIRWPRPRPCACAR
ncbi:MAG: hypothetical protein R2939_16770 [Kofleriaceae bacterium]